ncbi:hypothetical protein RND81_04G181300 [Saponaria officinalis]|uniref:Pentatricopeptide repeat-containing protein n=1 Tax=Saponaria officinalis TaxID=3572 RepID=A0AAW1LFP7_SAPOF
MKVPFFIKNGFTHGLNLSLVLGRKSSRFFSSVNLAFYHLSSSEDDNLYIEGSNNVLESSKCASDEGICEPYAARNWATNEFRSLSSSAHEREESGDAEMEVLEMILEEHGLGFSHFGTHGITFNEETIIKALNVLFFDGGNASLPLLFFNWLECSFGFKHTVRTVCSLIHILIIGKMNHMAIDLLRGLVCSHPQRIKCNELVQVLQDICTGSVLETVYSMIFRCYLLENVIDEAIETICLMKEVGMFPSCRGCNSLIKSLLELGYVESAWDFLDEMLSRFLVSEVTISLFIDYYCRKGNLGIGWKLLMHMNDYGIKPDVVAYTTFIHHLCKLSYVKEATCLVFKMIDMGVTPDIVLLTSIFDAYCKAERLDDAMCILKLFRVEPDLILYSSVISKFCKDNNMEQASSIFEEMLGMGIRPDCVSYTSMIDGYCKINNAGKALQLFGRMLKDGIQPSVITYTTLISCYGRNGDMEISQVLLQKLTRNGLTPDVAVYNTLINGYNNQGQFHESFELLTKMESVGASPDVVTYNTLINGLITGGYMLQANELMYELTTRGFSPDKVTFTSIMAGYASKGLLEESYSIWAYMNENNIVPDVVTCTALITGYCRAGLMDEANALFRQMVRAGVVPDLIMYNTLIHGLCRIGDVEGACQIMNMMIENGFCPNDVTYRALVLGYVKKHATNPTASAAYKMQLVLQGHGICFDNSCGD